jgi:peroxiredoxin family protein
MKKLILSIYLLIVIVASSAGQEVKISSAFDSTKIFIGDQIKFTVTIDQPSNLKLSLPVLRDTLCKNIEIISGPRIDTTKGQSGRIKIIQKYLITSFDSGHYQVKPVFAENKNEAGMKRFYSDYSIIEVMRVKIAPQDTTAKIFDIIKPYKAPVTFGEILPWLLIAALLGAIVWAAIRYLPKLRKSEAQTNVFIPSDPAHVIAFRELERLKSEELWQKGETKKYYTKLTEILRQYLENRFRVYSLELTTAETLEALVKTGFRKNGSYNDLKTVLTGADLVKFAKYNPVASENESHFQTSWNFVVVTKEDEMVAVPVEEKRSDKEGDV